ncbi:uncharacterized protein TNCV_2511971 [Trichonephila clavipes]|nr:uncharacterized protein TNCV_2511971 [Trichonephila clavipes]
MQNNCNLPLNASRVDGSKHNILWRKLFDVIVALWEFCLMDAGQSLDKVIDWAGILSITHFVPIMIYCDGSKKKMCQAGSHCLVMSLDPSLCSQSRKKKYALSRCCQVIYSQFGLAIHQNDHQARRRFVEWAQNEMAVVPDFHKRFLFSDEAHFWLNGYVNKQNCRIWSEANPQVCVKTPLHPEKLTVWCAL